MANKIILCFALLFWQCAEASQIESYMIAKPYEATDIQFSDDVNAIHNLSDYKGKVVLLNFWATWCEPCVNEMQSLLSLQKSMRGKNVVILPISIDFKGVAVVEKFYNEQGISTFPVLVDDKGRAFKEYKLQALPTTLIIDKKGFVIAKIMGEIDWNSKEMQDYLTQLTK